MDKREKLSFRTSGGIPGKIYIPKAKGQPKKHPCKGCYFCQFCSESRCLVCRQNLA